MQGAWWYLNPCPHAPMPQDAASPGEEWAPSGWRMHQILPREQSREGLPTIISLQAGWGEETDPAGCWSLSWKHPLPHPTPQAEVTLQNLLPTHGAGPSGESLSFLQQHLPGVPVAVHHHHIVGAHPEGVEAAIASLQAPEPQVELGVPSQLQQAPHQRQGRQAPRAPQTFPRPQGGSLAGQPPGTEPGQGQQQHSQQQHGGAGAGTAAARGLYTGCEAIALTARRARFLIGGRGGGNWVLGLQPAPQLGTRHAVRAAGPRPCRVAVGIRVQQAAGQGTPRAGSVLGALSPGPCSR